MRDLNYQLKQMCYRNRDGGFGTQYSRKEVLLLIANQLHEMGFRHMGVHSLKPKHVEALVGRWLSEGLSTATMKNRMTAHPLVGPEGQPGERRRPVERVLRHPGPEACHQRLQGDDTGREGAFPGTGPRVSG